MKKFAIFVFVLAVIGALIYCFFPLEKVVKDMVHKYGSEVTGTDVNLSGFDIDLKNGEASVKQITVANPKNYKTPYAIQLGNIDVKVNLKSVTTDTIIIDQIVVNKPVISYEMMSLTQNNISDIINNVKQYSASAPAEAVKEDAKKDDASSKKVIIKKVVISNGEINGAMTAVPDVISAAIPLPTITLNNVGGSSSSKGMSIADSIAFILNKLLSAVSTTVISNNLENLKDVANAAVDGAKGAANAAVDTAKETAGSVVDGVKGTLSGLNPFGK